MNSHLSLRTSAHVGSALLALAGAVFLALFVASLVYSRQYASTLLGLGFYFLLPGALSVISFSGILLKPLWKWVLVLSLAALWLGLVGADLYVSRTENRQATANVAEKNGLPPEWDTRSTVQVIVDLRKDGISAYQPYSPWLVYHQFFVVESGNMRSKFQLHGREVIPLSSPPNTTVVLCNETGSYIIYESDELGFNNLPGSWDLSREGTVVLGDSIVQGSCVPAEQNLVSCIRRMIPETLNVGIGGIGPLGEFAILREFVASRQPRRVLWVYTETDLKDLEIEKRFPLLMKYLEPGFSQDLEAKRDDVASMLRESMEKELKRREAAEAEARSRSTDPPLRTRPGVVERFLTALRLPQVRRVVGRLHRGNAADFELFRTVMAAARDETASWGGELHFVYFPSWVHFDSMALRADVYRRRNRKRVLEIVKELGIPLIDLKPVYASDPDPTRFFLGWNRHCTPAGYETAAEAIVEQLGLK